MIWCSIDPAATSGVAVWDGAQLVGTYIVRKCGNKGNWLCGLHKVHARLTAWNMTLHGQAAVVMEEGCGRYANAIKAQAELRGYIRAVANTHGIPDERVHVLNVSEWRRVIREAYGVSWPAKSEKCKALSVQLVKRLYGRDVSADEADAVLVGLAAMRERLVQT